MRAHCAFLCSLLAALTGCATIPGEREWHAAPLIPAQEGIATGFLNKAMTVDAQARPYVVYVPRTYDPARAWPCILFLHGMGERGDDGLAPTQQGIGRAIRLHPERFPAIVVFPQCPDGVTWDSAVADIEQALAQTTEEYHIDQDRLYLTGLSMGGYAAWQYGARTAERWAAIVPVCGGGNLDDASALARVPIWAFHGSDDTVVPPEESRQMVEAVEQAGGSIRYTEYPETGHNSWDTAYSERGLAVWLFRQRR